MSSALSPRLFAWSMERFPIVNIFSGMLLYFLVAAVIRFEQNMPQTWQWLDLVHGLGIAMQFLVLRVLDEHKDYEQDRITHPHRVLQRGLVSLYHLRYVGFCAAASTLMVTLLHMNMASLVAWTAMSVWTSLMTVEFFCGPWLRQRIFLYSISHMLILPFMIFWGATLMSLDSVQSSTLPYIIALTFLNGLIYEILRKTKGRDEEVNACETFSKRWGVTRSSLFGIGLHILSFAFFIQFASRIYSLSWIYYLPTGLALLGAIYSIFRFMQNPTKKLHKINEGTSALFVLLAYLSLIFFSRLSLS